MKKTTLVVVLALILTFAVVASASATTGKFYKGGVDYYTWLNPTGSPTPGTAWVASGLSGLGDNPTNPGVHANYLATTAKCGICHSVHRAAGNGQKLLPTADATCAGCHTGSTAITAKIITWAPVNLSWVPSYNASGTITNMPAAGGGGGPHNDPVWDTALEDGATTYPMPSYDVEPFSRYGCFTRRCHATNPHGANSSNYTIFAAKLLFNNSPADDDAEYPELVALHGNGTYGGDDAVYDALGATDAAVQRFADANAGIITLSGKDILINGFAPDPAETHALVSGLTCGRPSNPATGEDECHAEAAYAIVTRNIKENRNHATKISGNDNSLPAWPNEANGGSNNYFRTDNTGGEATGFGGNDNRDSKTGHVAGTFAAVPGEGSYAPIAGCTSCHDQTDDANTVVGNFTFPHGQTATGDTNLYAPDGVTMATGQRVRIWAGYSGSVVATLTNFSNNYANQKAFDGQCLKCHRDGNGNGIGLTK
jgi:predicted CXXCH cytochrome family protein